jgi:hypothetical protein
MFAVAIPLKDASCYCRLSDQDACFALVLPPLIFMQVPAGT